MSRENYSSEPEEFIASLKEKIDGALDLIKNTPIYAHDIILVNQIRKILSGEQA